MVAEVQPRRRLWLPLGIVVVSLGMVVAGFFLGEADRVLAQATQICLSCIGLGG